MKDNTVLLMTGEIILGVMGCIALCTGNNELAAVSAGAFVGLLAGHLNGTHKE